MSVNIVMGAQWGDEGKGKIIDYLAEESDIVVRFHGGNNAGHTVVNKYGKFPMHIIPSGIFNPKAIAIIANGVVLDLECLVNEINLLKDSGIDINNRLFISPRCHLIMPYHKMLDKIYEEARGSGRIGTTGKGIGPAYADKVSYNGIRLGDLFNRNLFKYYLKMQLRIKKLSLSEIEIEENYYSLFDQVKEYVFDSFDLIHESLYTKTILAEGAHGMFLDNDWGTYPYVTASNVVSGAITAGAGIPPTAISRIIGVTKAYTTRVGAGPFPTEVIAFTPIDQILVQNGTEFGTTTGRRRRTGWFDAEMVRFAAKLNGFTGLAITKLDVLDGIQEICLCTHYGGEKPIYKILKGWDNTKGITDYYKLPVNARNYLKEIEDLVGVKIDLISTGPERNEICLRP